MRYQWPNQTQFKEWVLVPEERQCETFGGPRHICDHRHHRLFALQGPVQLAWIPVTLRQAGRIFQFALAAVGLEGPGSIFPRGGQLLERIPVVPGYPDHP